MAEILLISTMIRSRAGAYFALRSGEPRHFNACPGYFDSSLNGPFEIFAESGGTCTAWPNLAFADVFAIANN